MQQIKAQSHILENIDTQFKCLDNNQAQYLCFNPECQVSAFMCCNTNCKCTINRHDDCPKISTQKIIKQIALKNLPLSKDLQQIFQVIDKIYTQMIEKLSQDRQQLSLIKQNYGLRSDEAQFFKHLKNRELDIIKGKNIYKLKNQIKQDNNLSSLSKRKVNQYWQIKSKQFQKLLQKLKQVYINKNYLKNPVFKWNKEGEKQGYQINGPLINRNRNNSNINMIFIQPTLSNEKKSVIGIHIKNSVNTLFGICSGNYFERLRLAGKNVTYSIHYNGYTVQNGITSNNSFTFTTGDNIYIMYDPNQKALKFNKNLKEGFYIIKNIDRSIQYSFYISGLHFGNSIELINQSQIPEIDWSRTKNQVIRPLSQQQERTLFELPPRNVNEYQYQNLYS